MGAFGLNFVHGTSVTVCFLREYDHGKFKIVLSVRLKGLISETWQDRLDHH